MMLLTNIKAVGLVVSDEKIFNVCFFLKSILACVTRISNGPEPF